MSTFAIALLAQLATIPTAPPVPTPRPAPNTQQWGRKSLSDVARELDAQRKLRPTRTPTTAPTVVTPEPTPDVWLSDADKTTMDPLPTEAPPPPAPTPLPPPVEPGAPTGVLVAAAVGVLGGAAGIAFLVFLGGRRKANAITPPSIAPPAPLMLPVRRSPEPVLRRTVAPVPSRPATLPAPARPRLSAMKFTDRSFAGPGEYLDAESIGDEIRFVLLWSTGPDEEETVGEAHHHSELEDLANHVVEGGARSADFLAWLKREPDNPHDPEAVAIVALLEDQMPETVSYLPRPVARHYGPLLAEIDEKTGREVVCRGRIIVPKEDRHHYSVVLRLSPALLAEFLVWVALPEEKKSDATKEAWKRRRRPEFWTSSTDAIRPTPAPLSGQEVSMGTIDPTLRPVRVQPAPVQEPARKPPVMPQKPSMTAAGAIGVTFGLILFTLGSFSGWNLILMVLGLVFIAAGYASRQKPPAKLCPSCRMEIPMEATVCGHCRSALPS